MAERSVLAPGRLCTPRSLATFHVNRPDRSDWSAGALPVTAAYGLLRARITRTEHVLNEHVQTNDAISGQKDSPIDLPTPSKHLAIEGATRRLLPNSVILSRLLVLKDDPGERTSDASEDDPEFRCPAGTILALRDEKIDATFT